MASIFQIRRGTANVTLNDGELYLHKQKGSIQFSSGSNNPFLLLPINAPVEGNILLDGDITASNAYFRGNVAISGNLFLGNNQSDNINALGVFTSDIKPGADDLYKIGNESLRWSEIYGKNIVATTITGSLSGSVFGLGNPFLLSSSLDNRLNTITTFTQSQENANINLAEYTASIDNKSIELKAFSGSINEFTQSQKNSNTDLANYTTSIDNKSIELKAFSGSVNQFTQSVNSSVYWLGINSASVLLTSSFLNYSSSVAAESSSFGTFFFDPADGFSASIDTQLINAFNSIDVIAGDGFLSRDLALANSSSVDGLFQYTASLKNAIDVQGSGVSSITTILGNLVVQGTQTSLDTSELNVKDKTITVASGSLTPLIAQGAGIIIDGANATILWNGSDAININTSLNLTGSISSSTINGMGNVTTYVAGVNTRLTDLEFASSSVSRSVKSLNEYTSSATHSIFHLNGFSASVSNSVFYVNQNTSSVNISVTNLNVATASLYISTASYNEHTASTINKFVNILYFSSSINNATASLNEATSSLYRSTASYNEFTQSVENRFTTLNSLTASYNNTTQSLNLATASLYRSTASYNEHTASTINKFDEVKAFSGSVNVFTQSVSQSLFWHNAISASFRIWTGSIYANNLQSDRIRITSLENRIEYLSQGGADVALDNLNNYTSSVTNRFYDLEQQSGSWITYGDKIVSRSFDTSTITISIDDNGYISASAIGNIVSSSQDTNNVAISIVNGIISANLKGEVLSGSLGNGILSSSTTDFAIYTSSISEFTQSISNSLIYINTVTASVNLLTSSLAITGSNLFRGNQIISGNVSISGSFTASLADGYAWVGKGDGIARAVATSSFSTLLPNGILSSSATNFDNYTQSVNVYINTYTQSINNYTESANLSINQINLVTQSLNNATSSYAITGSNSFVGDQIISGTLYVSCSSPLSSDFALVVSGNTKYSYHESTDEFLIAKNVDGVRINSNENGYKRYAVKNFSNSDLASAGFLAYNDENDLVQLVIESSTNNNFTTASSATLRSSAINGLRLATNSGPIVLLPQTNNISYEIGRITAAGFGLNTNDPKYILDVSGNVRFWNDLTVTGSFTASLQEGSVWVGGPNSVTYLVATSSLLNRTIEGALSSSDGTNFYNYTSSINSRLDGLSAKTGSLSSNGTIDSLILLTGSLATTGSNRFSGSQFISGNLFINGNFTVFGSSSIQNITGSIVDIGTNKITLNTAVPTVRFGGISVRDSNNTGTGSLWWDSINNYWLYEHPADSEAPYNSAILIGGPPNTGNLGSEVGLTDRYLTVAVGDDHISGSQVYDDGTTVAIKNNLQVTGSFTSSLQTGYVFVGNGGNITTTIATSSLNDFNYNVSVINTNTNASASMVYVLNSNLTLTLPKTPQSGSWVKVSNLSNTATCILGRNGKNIMGIAEDMILNDSQASFELIWTGDTNGWVIIGTR